MPLSHRWITSFLGFFISASSAMASMPALATPQDGAVGSPEQNRDATLNYWTVERMRAPKI